MLSLASLTKSVYEFAQKNPLLAPALGPVGVVAALTTNGGQNMAGLPGFDLFPAGLGGPALAPEPVNSAGVVKTWVANGTVFYMFQTGHIGCYNKSGRWKAWRPYHPIVFGKKADAHKLAKIIKKHRKTYAELNRVFGKNHRNKVVYEPSFAKRDIRTPQVEIIR